MDFILQILLRFILLKSFFELNIWLKGAATYGSKMQALLKENLLEKVSMVLDLEEKRRLTSDQPK